ncbi:MAG: hypothetical protein ABH986_04655 [archaeon]
MKYINSVRESFRNKPVFSIKDLRVFLAKKRISKDYSNTLIHNMTEKKEISRITKGFYSFKKDLMVSGFAFTPFYYGLQESLSIRNLWEQETNPVIVTPKKVRPGTRKILDSNVLIRRINRKMFFGFELIKHFDLWIPVSDTEKTLIDFAYFNEALPEEALKEIKKQLNKKKLEEYLKKCPETTRKKTRKLLNKE